VTDRMLLGQPVGQADIAVLVIARGGRGQGGAYAQGCHDGGQSQFFHAHLLYLIIMPASGGYGFGPHKHGSARSLSTYRVPCRKGPAQPVKSASASER